MFKKWIEDIRIKTRDMDKVQKREYIITYYWYHILIAFILLFITGLVIYHLLWGSRKIVFSLAIINQEVDYDRDKKIMEDFSKAYGIKSKNISVDSNYLLSYGDITLDENSRVNDSLFEKFFFGWNEGAIDAVIMPESFLKYCTSKDGKFIGPVVLCTGMKPKEMEEYFYKYNGEYMGIYVNKTNIADNFIDNDKDPLILVFLDNSRHITECMEFAEFIFRD